MVENPNRDQSNIKPNTLIDLENGYWFYNYDIKQEEMKNIPGSCYSFIAVKIEGEPTYKKCVLGVLRKYVSQDEEFDFINSYNFYQMGGDMTEDYESYLNLLKEIKSNVKKDFNIEESLPIVQQTPRQKDVFKVMSMTINTMSLTDSQALEVKSLYPTWESFIGQNIKKDTKIQYDDKLYKVVQDHLVQEVYPPSIQTASLYVQIVEQQSGTKDDPIDYPSDGNLVIYKDKYYKEDGILYLCIRDSGQPLYTKLANVIGNYVKKI